MVSVTCNLSDRSTEHSQVGELCREIKELHNVFTFNTIYIQNRSKQSSCKSYSKKGLFVCVCARTSVLVLLFGSTDLTF